MYKVCALVSKFSTHCSALVIAWGILAYTRECEYQPYQVLRSHGTIPKCHLNCQSIKMSFESYLWWNLYYIQDGYVVIVFENRVIYFLLPVYIYKWFMKKKSDSLWMYLFYRQSYDLLMFIISEIKREWIIIWLYT